MHCFALCWIHSPTRQLNYLLHITAEPLHSFRKALATQREPIA